MLTFFTIVGIIILVILVVCCAEVCLKHKCTFKVTYSRDTTHKQYPSGIVVPARVYSAACTSCGRGFTAMLIDEHLDINNEELAQMCTARGRHVGKWHDT